MSNLLKKTFASYRRHGFKITTQKIFEYLFSVGGGNNYRRFLKTLKNRDPTSVFTEIYEKNFWGSHESHSGAGSTVNATQNLRNHLPIILERFQVKKILDAPCGDFNWMRLVNLPEDVSYVGADIVPELIRANQEKYGNEQHRFIVTNLLDDPLPPSDILICRDCLFHFSYKDIALVLRNFVDSNIPLLLTTTHINDGAFINEDIHTGNFRRIDLFSKPFCFPAEVKYRLEDFKPPDPPHEIVLWNRTQIKKALQKFSRKIEVSK